ncbi:MULTISPECIES: chemotaxis protein CheW [Brevibacillus]|jgi:purine-binding chemotaxis protein CheW|uniref:CheW protein n=2 Tax=Brevibacillus TaxID=55080 RepID=A0A1I3SDZ4_9BACL|nr:MULTISPECIES: chemotaxis protein CheW [Brevibacillus]MED1792930.1 chemotaxis protein CheW [Brevibacillus nitrificans]MED1951863.1 chemotaxis protein CheW [Brevibacillus centrosporus]MED4909323.1 chemotaxis protein CheW [Brevibacillus centrosporus]RNB82492.1 chemotaxis protein CheW [Brevibacillus nitrificans]SFJ55761.1 CheW protein [Brevibacillus centrosporus]
MELVKQNHGSQWDTEGATAQSILFKMGNEYYGLSISLVREIIKPLPVTRFPKSPAYVEGVVDLRGRILPIINLRTMFGLEPVAETDDTRFVDLQLEGLDVGIIVDAVSEVMNIPQKLIEAAPPLIAGVEGKYLQGIARLNDKLIMLLDIDEIFGQWKKK